LTEEDILELARTTEGYSGSDITVVVKEAMMLPVRKCQTATRFRLTQDGFYIPTYPSDPNGVDMNLYEMKDPSKLKAPELMTDDFFQAIARIKPSVAQADLDRQIQFTNDFGQDG
jgi:vacuolar protein-sorting-associated protein 4